MSGARKSRNPAISSPPFEEQLARARPWDPPDEQVFDDLTKEQEAAFLVLISLAE